MTAALGAAAGRPSAAVAAVGSTARAGMLAPSTMMAGRTSGTISH